MSRGGDDFFSRMTTLSTTIRAEVEGEVSKVALAIDSAVVLATPRDTGRAASNWLASRGAPRYAIVPPLENPDDAIAEAAAAISGYKSGETIFIANNVPYIADLNKGSSTQAPAGFVEAAVAAGRAQIAQAKIRAAKRARRTITRVRRPRRSKS